MLEIFLDKTLVFSLSQWLNFELSGITCFVGKNSLNFYLRVGWLSEYFSLGSFKSFFRVTHGNFTCPKDQLGPGPMEGVFMKLYD